jgi:hypothetical protein
VQNVSHINANSPGWNRVLLVEFSENDLVEIITSLKHYHDTLIGYGKKGPDYEWPQVRESLRGIIAKCYKAREIEDNDPVQEVQ